MSTATEQTQAKTKTSRRDRRLDDGSGLSTGEDFPESRQIVQRYVVKHRNYYRRRATAVRRCFRAAGILMILGGASLPVVAALHGKHVQLFITILTVSVAALTALRTFYQWDAQWRFLRETDWKLTFMLAQWETTLAELAADTDETKREAAALAATHKLIYDAEELVSHEAASFFSGLDWPHTDTGKPRTPPGIPPRKPGSPKKTGDADED